jgi:hypothetical protein
MATILTSSQSTSSTGAVDIDFAATPVGGFNATAALDTATTATVSLQVRVGAEWLLADTVSLPDPTTGARARNVAVYPPYTAARWNVTAISGGSVILDAIGLGV